MRALILAAGRGLRLDASGHHLPKCLLEFEGISLLERHLRNLDELGIADVRICVGFRRELVAAALARAPRRMRPLAVTNPDFLEGSIVSLWTLRDGLESGDGVLLMDADVLYDPSILERLVASPHASALLVDRDFTPGDEPVKVCLHQGRAIELSKQIDPRLTYDACGESVGFFKLSAVRALDLARRCEDYLARGRRDAPHEEALRDQIREDPSSFGVEDVTGLPWVEIDYPEDVDRARDWVLPRIERAARAGRRAGTSGSSATPSP